MADTDRPENDSLPTEDVAADESTDQEAPVSLALDVKIDQRSACERHVTVSVARDDIDRYFDKEFS
ncbi:MAG: hypothetical protein ACYC6Y_29050, partial [Thermoguttaceae bacterium]